MERLYRQYLGDGFRGFVMTAVGDGGRVAHAVAVEKVQFSYANKRQSSNPIQQEVMKPRPRLTVFIVDGHRLAAHFTRVGPHGLAKVAPRAHVQSTYIVVKL